MATPSWLAGATADLQPVLQPGGSMDLALQALPASTNVPWVVNWVQTAATDRTTILLGSQYPGGVSQANCDKYIRDQVVPELDSFVAAGMTGAMTTFGGLFTDDQYLYGTVKPIAEWALYRYFIQQVGILIRARNLYWSCETGAGGYSFTDPCTTQQAFDAIERGAWWIAANCHPDTISNQAEPSSIRKIVLAQLTGIKDPASPNYVDAKRLGVYWQHWAGNRPAASQQPTMFEPYTQYCGGCMPSDGQDYANAVAGASALNNNGKGLDGCDTHVFPLVNGCAPANNQPWKQMLNFATLMQQNGLFFTSTTGVLWPIQATDICTGGVAKLVSQYCGYGRGSAAETLQLWLWWIDRMWQAGRKCNMRTVQLGYWSQRMIYGDLVPYDLSPDPPLSDVNNWKAFSHRQDVNANNNLAAVTPVLTTIGQKVAGYSVRPAAATPTISTFTVDNASPTSGETITFTILTQNATSATLSDGTNTFNVSPNGNYSLVPPVGNLTYTLTAIGSTNVTATVAVNCTVPATAPVTTFTTATSLPIAQGSAAVLAWTVTTPQAYTVTIQKDSNPPLDVTSIASKTLIVTPSATATFTMVATNSVGSTTKTLTITVTPSAVSPTLSLTIIPDTIYTDNLIPAILTITTNAPTVTLTNNQDATSIDLSGITTYTLSPLVSTIYTLTATNGAGSTVQRFAVSVLDPLISGGTGSGGRNQPPNRQRPPRNRPPNRTRR